MNQKKVNMKPKLVHAAQLGERRLVIETLLVQSSIPAFPCCVLGKDTKH